MIGEERAPTASAVSQFGMIGARALTSNLRRVDELALIFAKATSDGVLSDAGRDAAAGLAHQLAGSAGTFGFDRVSELARRVERFLADRSLTDRERCAAADEALTRMRRDLTAGPDNDGYLS